MAINTKGHLYVLQCPMQNTGMTPQVRCLASGQQRDDCKAKFCVLVPGRKTTAGDVADGLRECDTTAVRGLSHQIMHQFYCDQPSLIDSIASINQLCISSAAIPYLQKDAAVSLAKTLATEETASYTVTSAIRTIAEQYVLYQWSTKKRCGHSVQEDKPGMSLYMQGVAIKVQSQEFSNSSQVALNGSAWVGQRNGTGFIFNNMSMNVQKQSILSFQKLWNLNNPTEKIAADGIYTAATEHALRRSPASGFGTIPLCPFLKPVVPCCLARRQRGICTPVSDCLSGTWETTPDNVCGLDKSIGCC